MEHLYCPWEPATFLFISSNVPLLINYSHFIAIFSAMAMGLLIFFNDPRSLLSRLFVLFATSFSIWALLDVGLWATNNPAVVMFSWSLQVLLEPLTYTIAFFLFHTYIHKKLPPFKQQLIVFSVLLPLLILLPTTLNLEALQLSSCESIEGPLAKYYTYIANLSFIIMILAVWFKNRPTLDQKFKRSTAFFLTGLITFLLSFTSGNIISSFTDDWTISQYGLFGMPVFAALIAYSIVRFNIFKIQIAGAQMLVTILWILVCSLLFVETELFTIITSITLLFTTIAGFFLINSVRKEVEQREEIEELAERLERANKRLKELDKMKSEFVSIASHQLRSPLTSIRGYTSMLLEGSFGKLPQKAADAIERIGESSKYMSTSVEDYLNVSRIQAGNMKYEYSDVNICKLLEDITDELRQPAVKKGLLLTLKKNCSIKGLVNVDVGKTRQIIHNLINNAIKYTPEGSIKVSARDIANPSRVFIDITDTGVGMNPHTIEKMFEKFQRADNANGVNSSGTGLGLYIARKMAEDMGGSITATSEGEGKGSTFTLELPLKG